MTVSPRRTALHLVGLLCALALFDMRVRAGEVEVVNSPLTGEPGAFAADEIRRATKTQAEESRKDKYLTRVCLLVQKDGTGVEQNYSIRVGYSEGVRSITITGGMDIGARYGGLDDAEANRKGQLDKLKDSDHNPRIAQRGIKFNIPLDLRTPS